MQECARPSYGPKIRATRLGFEIWALLISDAVEERTGVGQAPTSSTTPFYPLFTYDDKKVACSLRRAPRKTERSGGKSQHKSLTMVELMFLRHGVRHENVTHVGAVRHFYYQPPPKKIDNFHSQLACQRSRCTPESCARRGNGRRRRSPQTVSSD
ncbi:uncharacterized protein CDAR_43841 [Caerostris darwini]|uniref:Uncharacterized protein n=1 Tax=Caerostris darwini TaxID=1538125 RepID=A0AAV4WJD0_9ARAC|nr:uncharacterized protein CDAR_43841 [Caerostris darwini]